MNELYEESDEAHNEEANAGGVGNTSKFCKINNLKNNKLQNYGVKPANMH